MRSLGRCSVALPVAIFITILCFIFFYSHGPSTAALPAISKYEQTYGSKSLVDKNKDTVANAGKPPAESLFSEDEQKLLRRKPRYAITSSVQTASFTAYALMLGYTIQKHNDLAAMDAEMVLLVRDGGADSPTRENITRLEQVGWKVKVAEELEFEGVDTGQIRSWHRHNLNKLHLWSWTEYEKILFIDADVVCKGSLKELWEVPGDFAAAPDVWHNVLTDNKFNSGVIVFKPDMEEFRKLVAKVSDPEYHRPNDADQAFLNVYYRFRYFGLPYKYNFNLIMYQFHRPYWDMLWDEAILIHYTVRKPKSDPAQHCHKGCNEWEPIEWYAMIFKEMLAFYGWEKEIPLYA